MNKTKDLLLIGFMVGVGITIALMTLGGAIYGFRQQDRARCVQWYAWEGRYGDFEITDSVKEQCSQFNLD